MLALAQALHTIKSEFTDSWWSSNVDHRSLDLLYSLPKPPENFW